MFSRDITILIFLLATTATSALADPGTSWNQGGSPSFVLVADLSPDPGLEGLHWDYDPSSGAPGSLTATSFSDFHSLGDVAGGLNPADTFVHAVDLDGGDYAEVIVFALQGTHTDVTAYRHDGTAWSVIWSSQDIINVKNTDLELISLNGDSRGGEYLLASGFTLQLVDPATGLMVWSSLDPLQGPGPDWQLVNWTMADYDQDINGDEEMLIEFFNIVTGEGMLWMLDEVATAAATPLKSTLISLGASRPNPNFGATTIQFELPETTSVRLNIYDVRGRRVKTLANRTMSAGAHVLHWDGNDRDGGRVAQGVYFYELKAGGQQRTRKMLVVR